jgi:hypothetical protein
VLAIGAGRWTTCEDICEALYQEECEVEGCGLFAGYLYLPTCKKVCFECFIEHPQYRLLSHLQVQRRFGLHKTTIDSLPHIRCIPGKYSIRPVWHEECFKIDYKTALDAGIAQHGSLTALDEAYAHLLDVEEEDGINIDVIHGLRDGGVFDLAHFRAIVQVLRCCG